MRWPARPGPVQPAPARALQVLVLVLVGALALTPVPAVAGSGADADTGSTPAATADGGVAPAAAVDDAVLVRWQATAGTAARQAVLDGLDGVEAVEDRSDRLSLVTTTPGAAPAVAAALARARPVQAAEPERVLALGDAAPATTAIGEPRTPVDDPLLESQWGLRNSGQPVGLDGLLSGFPGIDARVFEAWEVTRGDPAVRIAVIDSAVDATHPDLRGAVVEELQVADGTLGSRDHGTGIASVAAARADDGVGMAGVAPEVSLISVVAFGAVEDGAPVLGTLADVVTAVEVAVDAGADLINAAWVTTTGGQVLEAVIADAGVPVIAAAGNEAAVLPDDLDVFPAALELPNLLTVTAIDPAGRIPSFANTGAGVVDVAAPGEAVLVAVPGGLHAWQRGTSAAAPFVTGALALAVSAAPYATTSELVDAVTWTSRPLPSLVDTTGSGGMLDAGALVRGVQRPVCRRDQLPPTGFADVTATNPHRGSVACVVAAGVAQGRDAERFAPAVEVTRGQLASMLVAVLEREGTVPEPDPGTAFPDVAATHTHARAIGVLAALGIASGRPDGGFLPDAPVTRGQATALAVRTYGLATEDVRLPSRRWFADTAGSTFVDAIDRARDLGMVRGVDKVSFAPDRLLRRDQTATLLARTLDAVARQGEDQGDDDG